MEGWIWKALCNEAPFRFGKNLASSRIRTCNPWSEVGSANRSATRTFHCVWTSKWWKIKYKSTLQRLKRESVFHELYHTLTRKRKCTGIQRVFITLRHLGNYFSFMCYKWNSVLFFSIKLDPTNSFPSKTAAVHVRHIHLKLTVGCVFMKLQRQLCDWNVNADDRGWLQIPLLVLMLFHKAKKIYVCFRLQLWKN